LYYYNFQLNVARYADPAGFARSVMTNPRHVGRMRPSRRFCAARCRFSL